MLEREHKDEPDDALHDATELSMCEQCNESMSDYRTYHRSREEGVRDVILASGYPEPDAKEKDG